MGSIGVVSGGFGLTGLIERFGIERRLHTAGQNKARLDPFQPEKPEDVEWLLGMQGELHQLFIEWVRERRGTALDESAELFTGEVWTGRRALELGLVDGIGTAREVLSQRFPDAEPVGVEPRRPLLARLGVGVMAGVPGLGVAALGWLTLPMALAFFIFEVGLVATLQAFIFATLTSIYLGGATAEHH